MRSRLLIYALLTFCFHSFFAKGASLPKVEKGIIDLRNQNFENKIALNGQWKFYWQKLVSPSDSSQQGSFVDFPAKWNSLTVNGKKLPSFGYATYQVTLLLPKTDESLRISLPDIYCAYNLYLNDNLAISNGKVTTSEKGFIPHWEYKAVTIPVDLDSVKITLQIANFVHSKGGVISPIYIGNKDKILLERYRAEAIDYILTGCLCMGGLFFLGLYLLGNRDKAILCFSLYSIVFSYRIMGVGNYVLHSILPDANWHVMVRLEYISLFSSIGLFALYTLYLYRLDVNRYLVLTICVICTIFSLATVVFPAYYFSQLVNPFLFITLFCIGYTLYIYFVAYNRKRPGSGYALLSSLALMFSFVISLLHYWNLTSQLQILSFVGYITFFFLQSLILSHRVSYQLKKARKQAEQGLLVKSEFLSTMSHEIRTPLNSVIGMSHLLLKNNPREDQAEQLDLMLFSATNLLSIVNDILDFNKIEAGKISLEQKEVDIVLIIKNIVAGLRENANEKGIGLKLEIDSSITGNIMGDSTRIFQVITNLVHNAIKFTSVGYVKVSLKVVKQSEKDITLKLQVKDTGIGISKEKQKRIFERFTQADSSTSRSFGGTGLGLAISKKILELQNSTITLISEEGKGSIFYFVQTFKKASGNSSPKVEVSKLPAAGVKPFSAVSILLVEDNELNVMVAKSFLQNWGAKVDVATNGVEAVEAAEKNSYHLILMDLQMPVMDGYDATIKIREHKINTPIIALTANLRKDIEKKAMRVGIDDIIVKPFLPEQLFQIVNEYATLES